MTWRESSLVMIGIRPFRVRLRSPVRPTGWFFLSRLSVPWRESDLVGAPAAAGSKWCRRVAATRVPEPTAGLVLYVREGCHLCEQFLMDLSLELGPAVDRLVIVDVDVDPDLAILYGLRVPVLTVDADVLCEGVLDADRLRAAIRL